MDVNRFRGDSLDELPIRVDPSSAVPLAAQLSGQIEWLIAAGRVHAGDELPPVRELAERLGINLHTVRAAYRRLDAAGLVSVHRGRRARVNLFDARRASLAAPDVPSFAVGVIVPSFSSFYQPMLDAIDAVTAEHASVVFTVTAHDHSNAAAAAFERLVAKQVDGIIVAQALPTGFELPERGRPAVVFADLPGSPSPSVEFDLERSQYLATRHLAEHGHRRIGYVTPAMNWVNLPPKLAGHRRALGEAGLALDDSLVAYVPGFGIGDGLTGANRLLDLDVPPTAIAAATDNLALGALHAAADRGLRIPSDIALVGNDDISVASVVRPALTTVAQPAAEAGRRAAELLQELISGGTPEQGRIVLDCTLVIRETCGC